jgi:hypothetical protein
MSITIFFSILDTPPDVFAYRVPSGMREPQVKYCDLCRLYMCVCEGAAHLEHFSFGAELCTTASELYRLIDRHLLAKFSANFCG